MAIRRKVKMLGHPSDNLTLVSIRLRLLPPIREVLVGPPSANTAMKIQPREYNKDTFLQANCRFIVEHEADYHFYLAD
ncbi:hypothetical protein QYM36_007040 [Artemia franciscana]|nr:hypothetical protein QYM36_007040 [Artemia franciscana]